MKKLILVVASGMLLSGCAVYMATQQPDAKDLSVLSAGVQRSAVLAELGGPLHTEYKDGQRVDVFKIVDGYSSGAKAARAFGHLAADALTLGLWEIAGTPVEVVNDGDKMAYQVTYDASDKVASVQCLKGCEK